jgi:hypothetical protein
MITQICRYVAIGEYRPEFSFKTGFWRNMEYSLRPTIKQIRIS